LLYHIVLELEFKIVLLALFMLFSAGVQTATALDSNVVIWSHDIPELCYAVKVSPDGLTCANGAGQYVQIRNMSDGSLIRQFGEHDNEKITSIVYSPNGQYVFTGAGDLYSTHRTPYIKMWDANTGALIKTLFTDDTTYYSFVRSLDVSTDGTQVSAIFDTYLKNNSTERDFVLFVWDVYSGGIHKKVNFPDDDQPSNLKYSPAGEYLIIDNNDDIALYTYPGIEFYHRLGWADIWHKSMIQAIAVTSDGKTVASIDKSNIVKVWDVETKWIIDTFTVIKNASATSIEFDNTDKFLIAFTNIPQVWDFIKKELIYKYDETYSLGVNFDVNNNNDFLVAGLINVKLIKGIYEPMTVGEEEITIDILYPNPTNNLVNIEFTLTSETNLNIEVTDINGTTLETIPNIVYPVGLNTYQYNCSNLSNGTYFIKISSAEFNKVYKFVKMY
jgi:WD40 repeat protein